MTIRLFLVCAFTFLLHTVHAQIQLGNDIDGEALNDYSGTSISMSSDGKIIAIGANQNDGNGIDAGHVRVYEFISNSWVQKGMDIDAESSGNYSGTSIDLSADGNTVVIGASYESTSSGGASGQARVFRWIGGAWTKIGQDLEGEAAFDYAGYAVSISAGGNTVAIGATHNDGSFNDAGHVRVYDYNGTNWVQKGADIDGEAASDLSSWSVSLDSNGTTIAIGARQNSDNGANAGHIRVYEYNGTNWTQKGTDIDGDVAGDQLGFSVSISGDGNTLVAGAPYHSAVDYQTGLARVYSFNGTTWTQVGQDIYGESLVDWNGYSVAISEDATTIITGALRNDGTAPDAGNARVFELSGGLWVQKGTDLDAEAGGDWYGYDVCISDDGSVVGVSGINNSNYVGHVRVWSMDICPQDYAGANQLYLPESGVADYETDGAIESIQTINSAATVDYDSQTEITLKAGFCTTNGCIFHAFIDGCQGQN